MLSQHLACTENIEISPKNKGEHDLPGHALCVLTAAPAPCIWVHTRKLKTKLSLLNKNMEMATFCIYKSRGLEVW